MTASETQKMHADMNVKRIIAIFVMAVFVVSLVSDEALAQQRDLVPVPGGGQAGGTFVVQNGQSTYISPSSTYSFTYDHSANPPPPPASGGSSSSSSSSGGNTVETKKEIKIHPKNDGKRGGGATTIAPQRSTTRSTSTNSAGGGGPPDTPASPSSTLATTTHSLESLNFRIGQLRTLREQSQNVDNQAYFDSEIMMAENRRYQLLSSMSLSLQDPSLTLNSITNEQREILLNHIRNAQAASSAITSSNSRLIEINNQLRKDFNWEITNYDPTTQKFTAKKTDGKTFTFTSSTDNPFNHDSPDRVTFGAEALELVENARNAYSEQSNAEEIVTTSSVTVAETVKEEVGGIEEDIKSKDGDQQDDDEKVVGFKAISKKNMEDIDTEYKENKGEIKTLKEKNPLTDEDLKKIAELEERNKRLMKDYKREKNNFENAGTLAGKGVQKLYGKNVANLFISNILSPILHNFFGNLIGRSPSAIEECTKASNLGVANQDFETKIGLGGASGMNFDAFYEKMDQDSVRVSAKAEQILPKTYDYFITVKIFPVYDSKWNIWMFNSCHAEDSDLWIYTIEENLQLKAYSEAKKGYVAGPLQLDDNIDDCNGKPCRYNTICVQVLEGSNFNNREPYCVNFGQPEFMTHFNFTQYQPPDDDYKNKC